MGDPTCACGGEMVEFPCPTCGLNAWEILERREEDNSCTKLKCECGYVHSEVIDA